MIAFQLSCDDCGNEFHNDTADEIGFYLTEHLEKLRDECDTGAKMLCPNCMTKHNFRLSEEDFRQTNKEEGF